MQCSKYGIIAKEFPIKTNNMFNYGKNVAQQQNV